MGAYIIHPKLSTQEEIKIGVCRGDSYKNWETWFDKKVLNEFKNLGFCDKSILDHSQCKTLDEFIQHYEEINTEYIFFNERLYQIDLPQNPFWERIKNWFISENIGFVVWKQNAPILVTEERYLSRVSNYEYKEHKPIPLSRYVFET